MNILNVSAFRLHRLHHCRHLGGSWRTHRLSRKRLSDHHAIGNTSGRGTASPTGVSLTRCGPHGTVGIFRRGVRAPQFERKASLAQDASHFGWSVRFALPIRNANALHTRQCGTSVRARKANPCHRSLCTLPQGQIFRSRFSALIASIALCSGRITDLADSLEYPMSPEAAPLLRNRPKRNDPWTAIHIVPGSGALKKARLP